MVTAVAFGVALPFYPRIPDDLPPPGDPRRRAHPGYRELQRRGRVSATVGLVLICCGIAASVAFLHLG